MDPLEKLNREVVECRKCPRLVEWREKVAITRRRAYQEQEYWGKPVPGFGDPSARVFVVGLAPGAHGSNRTGRQFTGDSSGDFLYPALYRAGFASQPQSIHRNDGLVLHDLYTAPVCRCVPPDNRPSDDEISTCLPYLQLELKIIRPIILVALGRIAFDAIVRLQKRMDPQQGFSHDGVLLLEGGTWLVSSYHPSRQNTQTGRLSEAMFDAVWQTVRSLLER